MLKTLHLSNFRSYDDRIFNFDKITIFVGPNGIGKTNILEGIGFLALARSFRSRQDRGAIRWGEEVARVVGQTTQAKLEIGITNTHRGGKRIMVNGVSRRSIELLGNLMVVLFLPESLTLVAGPPVVRRQFLDLLLIQEDRRYAYHLLQLQKILRQRNRLLKQIGDGLAEPGELLFWDAGLAEHGGYIGAARAMALNKLNTTLSAQYQIMSQENDSLQLIYHPTSVSQSAGEQAQFANPRDCPSEPREWTDLLRQSLERHQRREIAAGTSLYGPQRDDFTFILDDRPLATFGSRGEYRSAILSLKASEAEFLLSTHRQSSESASLVFLLDDVYSELDMSRRGQLAKLIGDRQAIITTTDLTYLDPATTKQATPINLAQISPEPL